MTILLLLLVILAMLGLTKIAGSMVMVFLGSFFMLLIAALLLVFL